jgi:hypothetical protein
MFDSYGPFSLQTHDRAGIDKLYSDIRADDDKGLENAIGIYIIATNIGNDDWIPSYVGMTTRGSGQRLKEHLTSGKFVELVGDGPLHIHLIAPRDGKSFVEKSAATEAQKLIIVEIEQQLIDRCHVRNKKLLDKSLWSPNQIHVPGYIDKGGKERDGDAAIALAQLPGT